MSIIIKNMKMPESCCECPCCDSVDLDCRITCDKVPWDIKDERRPVWCPLVELPPHGDLIDRGKLKKVIGTFSTAWEYGEGVDDCWDAIEEAPTVIGAEDGE